MITEGFNGIGVVFNVEEVCFAASGLGGLQAGREDFGLVEDENGVFREMVCQILEGVVRDSVCFSVVY